MSLKDDLPCDTRTQRHLSDVYRRYREMHGNPLGCQPMVLARMPVPGQPTWQQMLADPLVMLRAKFEEIRQHLFFEDDFAPAVRIDFGTAQIAGAFGCPFHEFKDNLPACGGHVLNSAGDAFGLTMPSLTAGWFGKLADWAKVWSAHKPDWVQWQLPDIQSPFNSAHLIRGNDIFVDLIDEPAAVEALLDKVTDYMILITRHLRQMLRIEEGFLHDWGSYWPGKARMSNCSMQMISPALYCQHVLPRDARFYEAIGGGRLHYCGRSGAVIEEFFNLSGLTGLDIDAGLHDFWKLCEQAPQHLMMTPTIGFPEDSPEVKRLLAGDWPRKRNIVIAVNVSSLNGGRELVRKLRASVPKPQKRLWITLGKGSNSVSDTMNADGNWTNKSRPRQTG